MFRSITDDIMETHRNNIKCLFQYNMKYLVTYVVKYTETMIVTSLLHITTANADKFVENIVKGILGNFRLISIKGFVYSSANLDTINNKTWKYYWNGEYEYDDPHYVSWIWCLFLFTYHITGYEPICMKYH